MLILDTSEIQARKPNPQAREISRLTWQNASIPQNAIPFTRDGKPYVLEFDEYTQGTTGGGNSDAVGAGRIVDISDERQPRVISNLRLQVNQAADHKAASGDPGTFSPAQGYAAHYCNIPTRTNPRIVACSFIASGLRVFDISNLTKPKEIAYYVAPARRRRRTATTAATTRCRSRHSPASATRSGTRTAPAASTSCASRTGCGRRRRRSLTGGPQRGVGNPFAEGEPRLR